MFPAQSRPCDGFVTERVIQCHQKAEHTIDHRQEETIMMKNNNNENMKDNLQELSLEDMENVAGGY